jgi:phage gp29-like protein
MPKSLIVTPQQFALEKKWANASKMTPQNTRDPSLYPIAMSEQPTPEQANPMRPLILPQVRERWTSLLRQGITPERVEQILRGAFAGNLLYQWELFDIMEDTWPMLQKALNELKRSVERMTFAPIPYSIGKDISPLAAKKKDLLSTALKSFRPQITEDENEPGGMIYDLCDAIGKGISVQEILWEPRKTADGLAILPRCTKWVHPIHYGYRAGEIGLKLCPDGMGGLWIDFPANKFLIGISKAKSGHPIGGGLLRCLAAFWIASNFSWEWVINLAQMFGIPIRWATYDPTKPNLLDDLEDMLINLGSAGWAAFPTGTTLELKEAVQRAADNPQAYILEVADLMCNILILGQTLTTTVGKSGSRALGEVHASVRQDIIEYYAHWVAKMLRYQFIPALMLLNFGHNDEDPDLIPDINEPTDGKAMAERDQILTVDMGLPVGRKWLYDRHEIPMPEEGDEIFIAKPITGAQPPKDAGGAVDPADEQDGGAVRAKAAAPAPQSATDKLLDNVLEDVTGVESRWLAGVRPFFAKLFAQAQDKNVSDADLIATIEKAGEIMPELFPKMRTQELADSLYDAMSAACVNGASRGVMMRGGAAK